MLLMAVASRSMHYIVWTGVAPPAVGRWLDAASLGGLRGASSSPIRSGRHAALADPSLTLPQMLFAIASVGVGLCAGRPGARQRVPGR